jgi:hypothetical protein
MSVTLALVSRIGDQFSYQNADAIGFNTIQSAGLQSTYQMSYAAQQSDANNTLTIPTKYYEGKHSITIASSIYDIDLTLLVDAFGNLTNFSKIYRMILHNNDTTGGSGLIVKPGPSNGWVGPWNGSGSGVNLVPAGGDFVISSPYAGITVNGGTKVLRIQNDAASPSGSASFSLHLFGG